MRISLTGANGVVEPGKPQSLSGGFDPPILVQVTIPGALVTPTHQIIPLSGGDANFIVQPISSGKLKGAKVEFLSQGRKISEIPLPIKTNHGRLAKFLLALGILIPLLINFLPQLTYQQSFIDLNMQSQPAHLRPDEKTSRLDKSPTKGGSPVGTNSISNEKTSPNKSAETEAEKVQDPKQEKLSERTPGKPSALLQTEMLYDEQMPVLFVKYQVPGTKKDSQPPLKNNTSQPPTKSETSPKSEVENKDSKVQDASKPDKPKASSDNSKAPSKTLTKQPPSYEKLERFPPQSTRTESQGNTSLPRPGNAGSSSGENTSQFLPITGEDAIWAWTRHKLHQNGYPTKPLPPKVNPDQITRFFTVDRNYEITGESQKELTTSRMAAIGLYYMEPMLRFLYRVFIQFPRDVPLADLGFGLFFIALGVITWVLTGPNRKKIKGAVMDIRLAS